MQAFPFSPFLPWLRIWPCHPCCMHHLAYVLLWEECGTRNIGIWWSRMGNTSPCNPARTVPAFSPHLPNCVGIPGLVEDVLTHGRGVGTGWSVRSLSTQTQPATIIWSQTKIAPCWSWKSHFIFADVSLQHLPCGCLLFSFYCFLFKENSSTNSKTRTAWFVVDLKCVFKIPLSWCFIRAEPSCRLPSQGDAIFFPLDLTTCFQKCFRDQISLRASPLLLKVAGTGQWLTQTEIHMASDEIRFFPLKSSQKHNPLKCTVTVYIVPSSPITSTFGDRKLNLGVLLFLF